MRMYQFDWKIRKDYLRLDGAAYVLTNLRISPFQILNYVYANYRWAVAVKKYIFTNANIGGHVSEASQKEMYKTQLLLRENKAKVMEL